MSYPFRSLFQKSLVFTFGVIESGLLATVSLAEPVAIVEETTNYRGKVQEMDLLETGQRISLGVNGQIKISYLETCVVEQITGGEIRIGSGQSEITGGAVTRKKIVFCSTGGVVLSKAQSNSSGAIAFRGGKKKNSSNPILVYSRVPVIYASKEGHLRIRKENKKEPIFSKKIEKGMNIFTKDSIDLLPGSNYFFEVSEWSSAPVLVSVDVFAGYEPAGLLKRIIFLKHEK